jgi:hypothetical protein
MGRTARTSVSDEVIIQAFARIDRSALGLAVGILWGVGIFTATIVLLFRGGEVVGPNLALLGQFFFGYTVTLSGAFIGLVYGLIAGFIVGWLIAFLRNLLMSIYLITLKTKANLTSSLGSID